MEEIIHQGKGLPLSMVIFLCENRVIFQKECVGNFRQDKEKPGKWICQDKWCPGWVPSGASWGIAQAELWEGLAEKQSQE